MSKYPLYDVTVKSYMTKPSTPEFDFMEKWNDNIPMPFRRMEMFILARRGKMVRIRARGQLFSDCTQTCMCCGRPITNPVSRYFGLGPICGNHDYTNPFDSMEELKDAVNKYRTEYLNTIKWEGWVPISAITNMVDVETGETVTL